MVLPSSKALNTGKEYNKMASAVGGHADKPNRLQPQTLRVDVRLDNPAVLQALEDLQRLSSTNIRAQVCWISSFSKT